MHCAVTVILAERRLWPQMPGAASLLTRSLVEALGRVMRIGEAPGVVHEWERWFYREQFERHRELQTIGASNPAYQSEPREKFDSLAWLADKIELTDEEARQPPKHWQQPSVSAYFKKLRGKGPLLSGSRRAAFEIIYVRLYRELSWFVHQGLGAVMLPLTEEKHGPQPLLRSALTVKATTLLAAVLSELTELTTSKPPSSLIPLWSVLGETLELPRELYGVRYRKLLEQCVLRDLGQV